MNTTTKGFGFFDIFMSIAVCSIIVSAIIPVARSYIVEDALTSAKTTLTVYRVAMEQAYAKQGKYGDKDECAVHIPSSNTFDYGCKLKQGGRGYLVQADSNGGKGLQGYQFSLNQAGEQFTNAFPNASVPAKCWLTTSGNCQS